jgi:hypothetical protein
MVEVPTQALNAATHHRAIERDRTLQPQDSVATAEHVYAYTELPTTVTALLAHQPQVRAQPLKAFELTTPAASKASSTHLNASLKQRREWGSERGPWQRPFA